MELGMPVLVDAAANDLSDKALVEYKVGVSASSGANSSSHSVAGPGDPPGPAKLPGAKVGFSPPPKKRNTKGGCHYLQSNLL
eukprot:3004163-Lingulodinium_polyedra.AAC.1